MTRKVVNRMGLNRLGIDTATTAVAGERTSAAVVGYVSQYLNPLSGQCGPFPRPVLYEVTHPGGVDVHSGSELSTARIGRAPRGTVLSIVGRGFTDHPRDDCAERLKLSGGGGWISSRGGGGREEDQEMVQAHKNLQREISSQVAYTLNTKIPKPPSFPLMSP